MQVKRSSTGSCEKINIWRPFGAPLSAMLVAEFLDSVQEEGLTFLDGCLESPSERLCALTPSLRLCYTIQRCVCPRCSRAFFASTWTWSSVSYPSSVSMYHAYLEPNMVEGQIEWRKLLPERILEHVSVLCMVCCRLNMKSCDRRYL